MGTVGSKNMLIREFVVGIFKDADVYSTCTGKNAIRAVDKNKDHNIEDNEVVRCKKESAFPSILDEKNECSVLEKDDKNRRFFSNMILEANAVVRTILFHKCAEKFQLLSWRKEEVKIKGVKHQARIKIIDSFKVTGDNSASIARGSVIDFNDDGKADLAFILMISDSQNRKSIDSYIISAGTYSGWTTGEIGYSQETDKVYQEYLKAFD